MDDGTRLSREGTLHDAANRDHAFSPGTDAPHALAPMRRHSLLLRSIALIGAALLSVLICGFIATLVHSTAGEIVGALGSLIGGIVGAGGAVWAVFLLLSRQRQEETAKVADAVRTEITTLVKYVIGAVDICQQIKNGVVHVPQQDAQYIVKNFTSDPVIYPAIADRVGLLSHPHATTEFYMRLSETRAMVEALANKTDPPGITYSAPVMKYVTPAFAETVVESLITALQLARPIVSGEGDSSSKSQLGKWVQVTVVRQIDNCLESAKVSFPNAEAFRENQP
jgi:hypothetical protein